MKENYEQLRARYENAAEDDEELLSATEVDSSIVANEEEQWHPPNEFSKKRTRTRRCISSFRRHRWLIDTLLLLVNISLSVLLLRDYWQETSTGTMQVGGNFAGAGPDCEFCYHK